MARVESLSTTRCRVQSSQDRFGPDMPALVDFREFGLGDYFLHDNVMELDSKVPALQTWRLNLTALSQKYNLYFAAYQNKIYIYRPANVFRRIRSEPDCIIHLPAHNFVNCKDVKGHVDPLHPNHVNHMTVGLFGEDEILVTASDNGDISAFDTRSLAEHVYNRPAGGTSKVLDDQPRLLADNVLSSAWGLAIHAKSRLIAVSSNLAKVTVFAPALESRHDETAGEETEPDDDDNDDDDDGSDVEQIVRKRNRDWRIMVALPHKDIVGNIPAITFLDDEDGFADKVCCMGTTGQAWVAEIWKPNVRAMMLPQDWDSYQGVGWGVLGLKERDFLPRNEKDDKSQKKDIIYNTPCHGGAIDPPSHIFNPALVYSIEDNYTLVDEPDAAADDGDGGAPQQHGRNVSAADIIHVLGRATTDDAELQDGVVLNEDWDDIFDTTCCADGETIAANSAQDNEAIVYPLDLFGATAPGAGDEIGREEEEEAKIELKYAVNHTPGCLHQGLAHVNYGYDHVDPSSLGHEEGGIMAGLVYVPHLGSILQLPSPQSTFSFSPALFMVERMPPVRYMGFFYQNGYTPRVLGLSQYHILKTVENGFVIRHLRAEHHPRIYMSDVVFADVDAANAPEPGNFAGYDRLSMLAHVPELNIVIVGSAYGRATIMTLVGPKDPEMEETGPDGPDQDGSFIGDPGPSWVAYPNRKYSLQIEAVLPNGSEDKLRPQHPLYGMAVGPVARTPWKRHAMDLDVDLEGERPVFKLMLHYRDYSILSWELRRGNNDELEVLEMDSLSLN